MNSTGIDCRNRLARRIVARAALLALLALPNVAFAVDSDGDGHDDTTDNCPAIANADQADVDKDGLGDACDASSDWLYFGTMTSGNFNIRRSRLDGSGSAVLATQAGGGAGGITFDHPGGKMYFSDWLTKIQRRNFDGSGLEDVLTTGLQNVQGMEIDPVGQKLYFLNREAGLVQRMNLDGTGVEQIGTGTTLLQMDLDLTHGKIYWTRYGSNLLYVANFDGSGQTTLSLGSSGSLHAVAIDEAAAKIYFGDYWSGQIKRANLDGTGIQTLVSGRVYVIDLALQPEANRMYWTEYGGNLMRAKLDGTSVTTLASSLGNAFAVELYQPLDSDGDGLLEHLDNCPLAANPGQEDLDGDSIGDVCDPDADGDGADDGADNCLGLANPDQLDTDGDLYGDACDADDDNDGLDDGSDNCPLSFNDQQEDSNYDGEGDACDADVPVKVAGPFRIALPASFAPAGVTFVDQVLSTTTTEVDAEVVQYGPSVQFRTNDVVPAGWFTLGATTLADEHGTAQGGFLLQSRVYAYGVLSGTGQAVWTPRFNAVAPQRAWVGENQAAGDAACGRITVPAGFRPPGITFVDQDGVKSGVQVDAYAAQGIPGSPWRVALRTDDAVYTVGGAPAPGVLLGRTADDNYLDGRCFEIAGKPLLGGMTPGGARRFWMPKYNHNTSPGFDYWTATTKFPVEPRYEAGVVSHWRGQGNANDFAGDNDGAASGGVGYATGKIGQGFVFDGIDDVVTIPDDASLSPAAGVTLAAWVDFDDCLHAYGWCTVLGKSADGWAFDFEYGLIVHVSGRMSFIQGDGASYFLSYQGPDLRSTGWRHLAVAYDGSTVRYYVDGLQVYSAPNSVPLIANGEAVELGRESGEVGGAPFGGGLDDVVIFDRALTALEIQGLYQRRIGGN